MSIGRGAGTVKRIKCNPWATLAAALVISACVVPFCLLAQTLPSRQLTLIHPDDQEFGTLLNANFPGLEKFDGFAIFRPYLALLRNDTSHVVSMYMMAWERQSSSSIRPRPINSFVENYDPAPAAERVALAPGELRLVSPAFVVSPKEFQSNHQRNWVVTMMSTKQGQPPYSLADTKSVTPSVDAIFDDGLCVGADHHQIFERYQSELDAERDLAQELLRQLDAKTPEADVVAFLKGETDAAMTANAIQNENASMYAFYRGRQAQDFLTLYRRGGIENVVTRAWKVTQHRKQELKRVSQ